MGGEIAKDFRNFGVQHPAKRIDHMRANGAERAPTLSLVRPPVPGTIRVGARVRSESEFRVFDLAAELVRVLDLMKKYRNVPMSLADACLVRMTEIAAASKARSTRSSSAVARTYEATA